MRLLTIFDILRNKIIYNALNNSDKFSLYTEKLENKNGVNIIIVFTH